MRRSILSPSLMSALMAASLSERVTPSSYEGALQYSIRGSKPKTTKAQRKARKKAQKKARQQNGR